MTATINIVVAALGGQGGGVLLDWIEQAAHNAGWPTQATSVPGVAQRTGATIYYLEIYPEEVPDKNIQPVMSLFPMQNSVDLVVSSEIVEAGRMVQRGFVSPQRTTLITSDHRVYAIGERAAVKDSVIDAQALREIASQRAQNLIMFDLQAMAEAHNTVISATLFGAVAASGALPLAPDAFKTVIEASGVQVENNLAAFSSAYTAASEQQPDSIIQDGSHKTDVHHYEPPQPDKFTLPQATTHEGKKILERIRQLPTPIQSTAFHGATKLANYLDFAYAHEYLDKVKLCVARETEDSEYRLSREFAKQLALWMGFEDIIRVAHLKISEARTKRLHNEVLATKDQVVEIRDFFKPRVEEICGVLPNWLGAALLKSDAARRLIGLATGGKQLPTNHVSVFLLLRGLAGLRRFRRGTYMHQCETGRINDWSEAVLDRKHSPELALALAQAGALIKGYGATRERGYNQVEQMLSRVANLPPQSAPEQIRALTEAALADDSNAAFERLLAPAA